MGDYYNREDFKKLRRKKQFKFAFIVGLIWAVVLFANFIMND